MLTVRFSYLCWMRVSFVPVWFTIFTVGNLCRRVSRRLETSACPASKQRNPHLMARPPRRLLNIFHQAKLQWTKWNQQKKPAGSLHPLSNKFPWKKSWKFHGFDDDDWVIFRIRKDSHGKVGSWSKSLHHWWKGTCHWRHIEELA